MKINVPFTPHTQTLFLDTISRLSTRTTPKQSTSKPASFSTILKSCGVPMI